MQLQCRNSFSFLGELKGQPTLIELLLYSGVLGDSASKESACSARDPGLISRSGRSPGEGNEWLSTPVFLPGEFHEQRSLVGYSPWGCKELDLIEQLTLSLSCIGEGNGNPLQYACLENPRDGGARSEEHTV